MNEELDLGMEDLIQPRTLDLDIEENEAAAEAADDETLNSVIEKVNAIQENIKSAMRPPEEDLDDDEFDDAEYDDDDDDHDDDEDGDSDDDEDDDDDDDADDDDDDA